jgi:hypothetical protein
VGSDFFTILKINEWVIRNARKKLDVKLLEEYSLIELREDKPRIFSPVVPRKIVIDLLS